LNAFTYDAPATRVVFGPGRRCELPAELTRLGVQRALVVASGSAREVAGKLARLAGAVGVFQGAVQHVPQETADLARARAAEARADGLVAVGGGSAIGVAKAVALESALPILALPTTYSGSEMTPIYGITAGGRKRTGRDARVLPRVVIYDPELTLDLPPAVSGPSGMNALAHCVEAFYGPGANPVTSLMAEEATRLLAGALPQVVRAPKDLEARSEALYGACLAGAALAVAGTGLHHRLCHVLGGSYGLPHAETHAVLLPHVLAFNAPATPHTVARLRRVLGDDPAVALFDLGSRLHTPPGLRAIGMKEECLDEAAHLGCDSPPANPRAVEARGLRALLDDAFRGRRPAMRS
jgi:maleylacetate reductase